MVEHRPWLTWFTHAVLILGVVVIAFPIYVAFVASTHELDVLLQSPIPLLPGDAFLKNYTQALLGGAKAVGVPVWVMMFNSLVMALGITIGKIVISMLSAFAIVYFRFPFRMTIFWMIFVTLMLPVEVRILPTYKVVADLNMLDTYPGLIIPLIASATATFLFRQIFLVVPDELTEAARIDGAGPIRYFVDILLPLSRTNIAALFVILFVYGWVQYLWPLLITTDEKLYTILIGINRMLSVGDAQAQWQIVMATTMLAMLPPVAIVIFMQKLFVKGLTETEK
jgi:sn-glycerol 3-phosphate transport system permease protein